MTSPVHRPFASRRSLIPIRLFREGVSFLLEKRLLLVCLLLLISAGLMAALLLLAGKYPVGFTEILLALAGSGEETARMIVVEWRLPRIALAFVLGGALGMSGAIFQSLTRNPLGSPDVIGFSAGSYTGALIVIIIFSGGYYEIAAGALLGGVATALCVYVLAWRGGVQGFRLIIVGIGIAAMLGAFNAWLIREADLQVAMAAAIWGAGSLNGLGMEQLSPVVLMLAVLMPLTVCLGRPMRQLEMGDDMARASGVDADLTRVVLMMLGVGLTATVTAVAGPVAFISLAAPQISRRLARSAGVAIIPSALTGAILLMAADWAAQHAFATQLPVGIMTVCIGGLYFIWLLAREGNK